MLQPGAQLQYGPAPAIVPSVAVQIQDIGNGQIKLQWSSGTLLQSSDLKGSWTTLPNATSPYTATLSGSSTFYKVKVQ